MWSDAVMVGASMKPVLGEGKLNISASNTVTGD
jgi:hypothetical protein